ncbi:MAG TPA: preprotein translocase subunit SecG [Lacibacter sp.]|nr:preprotein translocase subunit SecG [Lacibacter sp.]HMO89750.1 preprotein translocase subunit SecG [Lacibacter sp.]HMP87675.1 preprotein translocase subunit SecG [Lacibacter sp.]
MTILFIILVLLASVLLAFVVLVQNPKGGGLSGNIAGFSNQFMGVKQTTDVLEKGTWLFAAIVGVLCLLSVLFISRSGGSEGPGALEQVPTNQPVKQQTAPSNIPAPLPGTGQ